MGTGDIASFLAKKEAIQQEIQDAMLAALLELGDGVHGVDWFSAAAHEAVADRIAA